MPLANYKNVLERMFGSGAATFDASTPVTNNVIGALARSDQFHEFRANFTARLERIAAACKANPSLLSAIKPALNQVADEYNWNGAYAELAVIDFLIAHPDTSANSLKLDVTLPANDTLASEMGYTNVNIDVLLTKFHAFLDTKILSDKSGDILDGIIKQVLKKKGIGRMTVLRSYNTDLPFEAFQDKRADLYRELLGFIDPSTRLPSAKSSVIDSLTYKFAWEPGVLMGKSTCDPVTHAQNHHTLLFKHAKKFHRSAPSAIAFVHFPWSGERLWPMGRANETFFRTFARSFFEGYRSLPDKARTFNSAFKTDISAFAVTKKLSAVIFLEDNAILGSNPASTNIQAYVYENEEADNLLRGTGFLGYLRKRCKNLRESKFAKLRDWFIRLFKRFCLS